MRLPLLLALAAAALAGCRATEIPPPPATFNTVVLTSDFRPDKLYAEGLAAFLRAGWEPITPVEEGLTTTIRPEGSDEILLAVRVEPAGEDDAVLTATVSRSGPEARDVLIRTARVLAGVTGTLSYR